MRHHAGGLALACAWVLVGLPAVTGCVPASPDEDTYRTKVALTSGGALSEVATVRTTLEALHANRMFQATAIAQIRASQDALGTNSAAFAELNPPPALDGLYARTSSLLSDGSDLVTQARIAVDRHRTDRYPEIADDLRHVARQLARLETSVS